MRKRSQSEALRDAMARRPVQVIAVTSGKGGVGKTNVAANIAVALGALDRNVMLLDADLGLANVDVLLDLRPRFNLANVISGDTDLDSTILRGPNGIRIVPAASGDRTLIDLPAVSQAAIIQAFGTLGSQPDVLLVDTAAGISDSIARFVSAAQRAIVVVCDEPAAITDAYALIKVLSRHYGITHFDIVTNQTRDAWQGRLLFGKLGRVADRYLDVVLRHLGNVPYDQWLRRAVQEQRAVVDAYPRSDSSAAFMDIARALASRSAPRSPTGNIEFFFERLLAQANGFAGEIV